MAPVFKPLSPSLPAFASAGVPYSERYADVYHAVQGAVEQAQYVFLAGNGLPERWRGRERFTVCETGFGLGYNFLALWQAWRADPQRSRRLHMVSIEAHPFSREHMGELLAGRLDGELRELANMLVAKWPPLLPGLHRIDLDDGAVTLTLGFGYALDLVPQLTAHVDAYFLDGFSPARNPEMWSPPLMKALARLAAPGATASTWSSAGEVRRGLAEAGFAVKKIKGFGYKRVMTVAQYEPHFQPRHAPPPVPEFAERHAVVVGAGIAGANVAYALALRGWRVTVLDARPAGPGISEQTKEVPVIGHVAAAMTPLIARDDNARARLTRAGALRAQARWAPWMDGGIVSRCGTLQLARTATKLADLHTAVAELGFPAAWVRGVDVDEASELAGTRVARGGVFFADGLRVQPQRLVQALLDHPGITIVAARVERLVSLKASTPSGQVWQAVDEQGSVLAQAEAVVIANATDAPGLLSRSADAFDTPVTATSAPKFFEQQAVAGQISALPVDEALWGSPPACIVAGEGYVLPPVGNLCVTGSTYVYDVSAAVPTREGNAANLQRAAQLLPSLEPAGGDPARVGAWSGWRAVVPGRLPVVGALPATTGLWLACGYASRGLTWSALAGDILAANLEGEPLMLERELLQMIGLR